MYNVDFDSIEIFSLILMFLIAIGCHYQFEANTSQESFSYDTSTEQVLMQNMQLF